MSTLHLPAETKRSTSLTYFWPRIQNGESLNILLLWLISLFLQAGKVLDSFKSAFVHALSLSMPPALCEYCPYKQMQQLCKSLEGTYTYLEGS